jgi:Peptidase A4 family
MAKILKSAKFMLTKRLVGGFILVAAALIVVPASATTQSACPKDTSPYDIPSSSLGACGYHVFPMTSEATLSDGGTSYVYDINGGTATFNVPPAKFNPVTATSDQLAEYGFPARPSATSTSAYSAWVSRYQGAQVQTPPSELISAPVVNTPLPSDNWSGYIATNASSTYYDFVDTQYVQPSNTESVCTGGTGVSLGSIWSGLGGLDDSDLVQDGTYFGSSDSSLAANGQFWFEFAPSGSDVDSSGSVILTGTANPGDVVESSVVKNSGNSYSMQLYNTTSEELWDPTISAPAGFTFNGGSADFIIETPSLYSGATFLGYANLPDFDSDNFDYASVGHSSSIAYLSTYTHQSVTMIPGSMTYASAGSLGTDSSFTDTYGACSG